MKRFIKCCLSKVFEVMQECHKQYLTKDLLHGFCRLGVHPILNGVEFDHKERIKIGDYVYIGCQSTLCGLGGITIGDFTIISSQVVILSSMHNYHWTKSRMVPYDEMELLKPVALGKACWIGLRAIVMPGVNLGDGCVVAAGAVVTKSWPAGTVLAGVPAQPTDVRDMGHFRSCLERGDLYLMHKARGLRKVEVASTSVPFLPGSSEPPYD